MQLSMSRRFSFFDFSRNENSLSGSLDDESIQDQDVSQAGAGTDHRRISSTYEGAEELLQRVLNDEVIQTQLSLEDTGDLALLVQADNGDDAKESTFEAEEPHLEPPESPMPEYQPPARRTSRIMMSLLTVDGDVSLTIPTPS